MRYRIGQMVPDSNTWCIRDLDAHLGSEADVTHALMHLPEPVTVAGELLMLEEHAPAAAAELASVQPDVVLFACSSATSLLGPEKTQDLYEHIEGITGAPVLGINDVVHSALRRAGLVRISVVAPYEEQLTASVVTSLRDAGFEVTSSSSMGVAENRKVAQVEVADIVEFACSTVAGDPDGVFVACGNLRALDAKALIEQRTGLPVVTANSAAVDELRRFATAEVGIT